MGADITKDAVGAALRYTHRPSERLGLFAQGALVHDWGVPGVEAVGSAGLEWRF